ncbi:hypothetical protein CH296_19785 [Rhodococcus sp. 14-2496-1d]|nr:hypothetical protein CH296_19785 [Rhodococcus sp. 14-2496-1d]
MAGITPQHPITTATKEPHLDMAKSVLAKVYEQAPFTAQVDSAFWLELAGLHSFLSGPAD